MANRRKISSIFKYRPSQLKRVLFLAMFGLLLLFLISYFSNKLVLSKVLIADEGSTVDLSAIREFSDLISQQYYFLLIAQIAYFCVLGVTIIILEHRMYGPMVAMQKFVQELAAGRKPQPLMLRKNDEFKELAEELNRLLEKTNEKQNA